MALLCQGILVGELVVEPSLLWTCRLGAVPCFGTWVNPYVGVIDLGEETFGRLQIRLGAPYSMGGLREACVRVGKGKESRVETFLGWGDAST